METQTQAATTAQASTAAAVASGSTTQQAKATTQTQTTQQAGAQTQQTAQTEQTTTTTEAAKATQAAIAAFDVKLPEGAKVDEKLFSEFKAIMGDEKTSLKDRAQKLVDLQFTHVAAQEKAYTAALDTQRAADLEVLKADKEFGGANFEKTLKAARSAEQEFFGEAGAKKFKALGMENDPDFVKGLARIRAAIAEDTIAGTGNNTASRPSTQYEQNKARYPKSPELWGPPN